MRALALAAPAMLSAQPVSGLHELLPAGQAAGPARLRFWGLDAYDASLWVAPGFRQADFAAHGFALQLQYLRGFSGADIAQRSIKEMRRGAGMSAAQAANWQAAPAGLAVGAGARRG